MSPLATLQVRAPAGYAGNFPRFGQPKEVACFSRDATRRVTYDRSALRPYRPARLPARLDDGFETYVPRQSSRTAEPAPLADMLGALAHKRIATGAGDVSIVTYRNNLNKLFLTPYCLRDDWEIGVERRADGVVLLNVRETARKIAEEASRDERSARMAYWGYKFEQLSTLDDAEAAAQGVQSPQPSGGASAAAYRVPSPSDPGSYDHLFSPEQLAAVRTQYGAAPSAAGSGASASASGTRLPPVNANEEFCSIVLLTIEKVKVLMAAEIDCVAERGGGAAPGQPVGSGYVELKTTKQQRTPHDVEVFEKHKLLKFWLQSFLANVPSVIVGLRDESGNVTELKTYETKTIHRIVRPRGYWDPTACFNFGKAALEWLLAQMEAHAPRGTAARFIMRYDPAAAAVLLLPDDSPGPAANESADTTAAAGAKRQRSD